MGIPPFQETRIEIIVFQQKKSSYLRISLIWWFGCLSECGIPPNIAIFKPICQMGPLLSLDRSWDMEHLVDSWNLQAWWPEKANTTSFSGVFNTHTHREKQLTFGLDARVVGFPPFGKPTSGQFHNKYVWCQDMSHASGGFLCSLEAKKWSTHTCKLRKGCRRWWLLLMKLAIVGGPYSIYIYVYIYMAPGKTPHGASGIGSVELMDSLSWNNSHHENPIPPKSYEPPANFCSPVCGISLLNHGRFLFGAV